MQPPTRPSTDAVEFQRVLRASKNIIAIVGAGLSAASGIPTFRTGGGFWKTHDVTKIATKQAFERDPVLVWRFYHERRRAALAASPNAAHYALAVLAFPSYLSAVAPHAQFTLITQNVDVLSTRAHQDVLRRHSGEASSLGSSLTQDSNTNPNIVEMHGRLVDTICTGCGHRAHNTVDPLCPAFAEHNEVSDPEELRPRVTLDQLPHCDLCGALLRPGVVWFDEIPHHLREINALVDKADLCLVVGTSSTVYPAGGYAHEVKENGGTVAVFNSERTEDDEFAQFFFLGRCEETLPRILLNVRTPPLSV
ncbi:DHS-like NAD/FAD-binding domain-containing protein [Mycena crocata]|nr:DHS-like NAD/FAD-binding domain-containing protein [Mycena crocata]